MLINSMIILEQTQDSNIKGIKGAKNKIHIIFEYTVYVRGYTYAKLGDHQCHRYIDKIAHEKNTSSNIMFKEHLKPPGPSKYIVTIFFLPSLN